VADLLLDTSALEAARTAAAGAAGPTRAATDAMPVVSPVAFGSLAAAPALLGAVNQAVGRLSIELETAARHLEDVDRALDATITALRRTDDAGADALGGPAPVPGG
jgi:hypothetical protein